MSILKSLQIGRLHEDDVKALSEAQSSMDEKEEEDPFSRDPDLSPLLQYHIHSPINAEPPPSLLTAHWITPVEHWFARNHHPVPVVSADESLRIVAPITQITSQAPAKEPVTSYTLDELKEHFPHRTVVSTIQCGGNRRGEMSLLRATNGTSWGVGAIATAKWTGVALRDLLLKSSGISEEDLESSSIRHVQFISHDGEARNSDRSCASHITLSH
jgi:sulfite oxidase